MALKIKVCGMCQLSNIGELVKLDPDYIGFIFYPKSKRFIGEKIPEQFHSIIPASIQKAGVFVNEPFDLLIDKVRQSKLDIVQLHGAELPDYCLKVKDLNIPVIKAFGIFNDFDFATVNPYEKGCDYFLFDTASDLRGGTGLKFNWEKHSEYKGDTPFFLSGGIQPDDIEPILDLRHPVFHAVDINSGFEIKPGIKDIQKLKGFIDGIRS